MKSADICQLLDKIKFYSLYSQVSKFKMTPKTQSFWHRLAKPIMILAPMEDVTDTVFRRIIADCGRPDVMFTEFTNCEGAQSVGQAQVVKRLKYTEIERPLVAQIWGVTPEDYYKTAVLIRGLGFDGIDINMGCPVRKIIKQGACSALIKNPSLAKEIVEATKEGAGELPLSIKTRIGFSSIQTEEWLGFILRECRPEVLTVHGRTVKEASKVPNHWDEIGKVASLNRELGGQTLIVGNGDVKTLVQARDLAAEYGLDGIMIGRGILDNPWLFNPKIDLLEITLRQKIETLKTHLRLFDEVWGQEKNFSLMKKYYKIYINGFAGAADIRAKLMECDTVAETLAELEKIEV